MISYREPWATWLGSPNFTSKRDGHDMTQPSWVVLHTMVGTVVGADARFQNPDPRQKGGRASATYGVGLDGRVWQWVDEANAAWANGATGEGGRGDNLDSISIEHEDDGDYDGPRTPALYAASVALVRSICARYGVPVDRDHVIGHRECDHASTACPDGLDVDRIVREAAASPTTRRNPMTVSHVRESGLEDHYTLVGVTIRHVVTDCKVPFAPVAANNDTLPGTWAGLVDAGVDANGYPFVRGYGTDPAASLWVCWYAGSWQMRPL